MKKLLFALLLISATATVIGQTATHCKGTKADGTPCKSTILLKDGYCRAHSPSTPKCGFIKKDGKPCKMIVSKAGDRCKYHNKTN